MNLTKEFLNWIAKEFDIGEVKSTIPLAGRMDGNVWELETTSGIFILKKIRAGEELKHTLFVHELLQKLHNSTFPYQVTLPIQSTDKRTVIDAADGLYWCYERILGTVDAKNTKTRIVAIAKMLAMLHRTTREFQVHLTTSRSGFMDGYRITEYIEELQAVEAEQHDAVAKHVRKKSEKLLAHISLADETWEALPTVIVHEDARMENMVFEKDILKGVIDFQNASRAPRITDLAMLLFAQCREGGTKHRLDFDKAAAALRAYHELEKLTCKEIEYIPKLLTNLGIINYWYTARQLRNPKIDINPHMVFRQYKSAMWFSEHAEEIIDWAHTTLNL